MGASPSIALNQGQMERLSTQLCSPSIRFFAIAGASITRRARKSSRRRQQHGTRPWRSSSTQLARRQARKLLEDGPVRLMDVLRLWNGDFSLLLIASSALNSSENSTFPPIAEKPCGSGHMISRIQTGSIRMDWQILRTSWPPPGKHRVVVVAGKLPPRAQVRGH